MPYVITTTTEKHIRGDSSVMQTVERQAVATLEEAQATVVGMLYERGLALDGVRTNEARTLSESGGTITLADGTEIEVKPVTYDDLIAVGLPCPHPHGWGMLPGQQRRPAILAAYNAAQEP